MDQFGSLVFPVPVVAFALIMLPVVAGQNTVLEMSMSVGKHPAPPQPNRWLPMLQSYPY